MVTIPSCPPGEMSPPLGCSVGPDFAGDACILPPPRPNPIHLHRTYLRGGKRESWTTELGGSPKE